MASELRGIPGRGNTTVHRVTESDTIEAAWCAHTHTHRHAHTHAHTHTHVRAHTHTHTHTLEYYLAIKKERKNAI